MTNKIILQLEAEQMTKEIPVFSAGDTVIIQVKVREGDRQRLQAFEGVVIAKRNRGINSAFTVRKISSGVGVERTFQTYSPLVDSITVKRRGDVNCTTYVLCLVKPRVLKKNCHVNSSSVSTQSSLRAALLFL